VKRKDKGKVAIWRPFPSPDPERDLRSISAIIVDTFKKVGKAGGRKAKS